MSKRRKQFIALLAVLALAGTIAVVAGGIWRARNTRNLPVLMYHHFAETAEIDTVVSAARFREQMTALKEAGFTAVTLEQTLRYVEEGGSLPEKPVLITMDDGYTSNLDIAAPVLEELGLRATVFVIGINEGETTYVHSGEPLSPARFSYEEAARWVEKGVLDLQCHTFDMHQLASYGFSGREGMLPLPGETEQDHTAALKSDLDAFRQRRSGQVSTPLLALAYPFGYYDEAVDAFLAQEDIVLTFTVEERCSRLVEGDLSSLRKLGRFNVTDRMTGGELVQRLERAVD